MKKEEQLDRLLYKIILASLLHDIGKVYERSKEELDSYFVKKNCDIYQPYEKNKGYYTHKHVLYTVKFIEDNIEAIPWFFREDEKEEISLINLAGKHHKPESIYQLIISVADRLSSGYERRSYDDQSLSISGETSADIPLLSIFEDIDFSVNKKEEKQKVLEYGYQLDWLSPENIFPKSINEHKLVSSEHYRKIGQDFKEKFNRLPFIDRPHLWLECLNTLLMRNFIFVPSAIFGLDASGKFEKIQSDISLYDHLYFTASLSCALYLYHKNTNTLTEEEIKNHEREKFLFIEGNFYGIQKFIFSSGGETRKWAAKILRGRSFVVSLLTELVADYIMDELSLPYISLISSAAGKFLILAPNLEDIKGKLLGLEEAINDWFYENYYGEASIGLTYTVAKPSEFLTPDGYTALRRRLGKASEEKKFQKFDLRKYGGVYKDYFLKFSGLVPCKLCGKRPADKKVLAKEDIEICSICKDHVEIGEKIVKNELLLIFSSDGRKGLLLKPFLDRYQIDFKSKKEFIDFEKIDHIKHIWDISLYEDNTSSQNEKIYPKKFINAYVPKSESGQILTFEEIAERSLIREDGEVFGIRALGVFKADVDNLGDIFNKGFKENKRTFARYLALSRMLNLFFAYYLPYLCQQTYKNIYNVFCGGDDLFVLGPWVECYEFVKKVNEDFKKFVCYNECFSISGGFILIKPNLPVLEIAERSEEALSYSKNLGKKKLTIFGEAIPWESIEKLEKLRVYLYNNYKEERFTRAFLYKLNSILEMVIEEETLIEEAKKSNITGVPYKKISSLLWPSLLYYFAIRNFRPNKQLSKEGQTKEIEEFLITLKKGLEEHRRNFKLPLWQILYLTRRAKDGEEGD